MRRTTSTTAAALAALLLAAGCGEQASFQAPPPPTVTVQAPRVEDVTIYKEFTGRLEAVSSVDIRARVQGFLETIDFEAGDTVKGPEGDQPGQLMFTIERAPFEARLNAAKASQAQATAARDLAKVRRDRTKQAFDQGAANELELIERQAELDGAEANVLAAEADVQAAQIDLDYTEIHAPLTGRVSRNLVDVGNLVGGAQQTLLTTIVKDDPIYAYVDVSERDLLEFVQGQSERPERRAAAERRVITLATADGARHKHTGAFDFAETRLDERTGTLQIRAEFPNPEGTLYPGMFVRVLVPDVTGPQTVVPDTAIQRDLAGSYVMVVAEGNKVERRAVKLGALSGTDRIITDGLSPEDRVVVNGVQRAYPGAVVNPEQAPAAPPAAEPAAQPAEAVEPADVPADEATETPSEFEATQDEG